MAILNHERGEMSIEQIKFTYGNMNDYSTYTSVDFGAGEQNTTKMISKWNSNGYGLQSSSDMWGLSAVQSRTWNDSEGWYVPSRGEWAAFGDAFDIIGSNTIDYGLPTYCWSSSQFSTERAWFIYFYGGYVYRGDVDGYYSVRLGTTF